MEMEQLDLSEAVARTHVDLQQWFRNMSARATNMRETLSITGYGDLDIGALAAHIVQGVMDGATPADAERANLALMVLIVDAAVTNVPIQTYMSDLADQRRALEPPAVQAAIDAVEAARNWKREHNLPDLLGLMRDCIDAYLVRDCVLRAEKNDGMRKD